MLVNLRVVNDYHAEGPHQLGPITDLVAAIDTCPPDSYLCFNGDNTDIKNSLPKRLYSNVIARSSIKQKVLSRARSFYNSGNHSGQLFDIESILNIADKTIFLTHGDYVMWGAERAKNFRTQKLGRGRLARFFIRLLDIARHLKPARVHPELRVFVDKLKGQFPGLKALIVGHNHFHIEEIYNGVHIIVLDRGINDITVEI